MPEFNFHLQPSKEVLAQAEVIIAVVNSSEDVEVPDRRACARWPQSN